MSLFYSSESVNVTLNGKRDFADNYIKDRSSLSLVDHFTCIVKVLFTLLYTQGLVALSVKCNEDDRSAWKHTGALKKVSVLSEFVI